MATTWKPSAIWSIMVSVLLVLYCILIRLVQANRGKSSKDALFVLAAWHPVVKVWVVFVWVMFIVVPLSVYIICNVGATVLAPIQDWKFHDTYDYLLCNTLGIGPFNDLTPDSEGGRVAAMLVAVFNLLVVNAMLGLTSALGVVGKISDRMPSGLCGFVITLFILFMVLLLLNLLFSSVLSAIEDEDLWDVYLYLIGLLCGIENPLSLWFPKTTQGNFFSAICCGIETAFSGALIGIIGNHPVIASVVVFLQGPPEAEDLSTSERRRQNEQQAAKAQQSQLVEQEEKELALAKKEIANLKRQLAASQATVEELSQSVPAEPKDSDATEKKSSADEASPDDPQVLLQGAEERIRVLEGELEKEKAFRLSFQQNLWALQTRMEGWQEEAQIKAQLEDANRCCSQIEKENSQLRNLITEMQMGGQGSLEQPPANEDMPTNLQIATGHVSSEGQNWRRCF